MGISIKQSDILYISFYSGSTLKKKSHYGENEVSLDQFYPKFNVNMVFSPKGYSP